jgi:hypothetical protein
VSIKPLCRSSILFFMMKLYVLGQFCRSILALGKRKVNTVSFIGLRERTANINHHRSFSSYMSSPSEESNKSKQKSKVEVDDRLSDSGTKQQEQQLTFLPPQQIEQQQIMEIDGLQQELQNAAVDIAKVQSEIDVVEEELVIVQRDIEDIEEKLENNMRSKTLDDNTKMYYLERLKDLRDKRNYLWDERKYWWDKRKYLWDKEKDLRDEENILLQLQLEQQQTNQSHNHPSVLPKTTSNDEHIKMEIRQLKDAVDQIQASQRATPQISASLLGNNAINHLKENGCFLAYSCFSPADMDKRSVLTLAQQEHLLACETEHQVVAFITPYLEELVQELENYVVVNSEECKWLEVGDDAPQKPDLFVGHEAVVTYRSPFQHNDTKLASMRRPTDKFGMLTHWKLRSCIGMTCEAKQTIDNEGFGQIINYGSHICRNRCRVGDDGPELSKFMLFDKKEFWLIIVTRRFPSSVTTCQWTTPGSFDLIRNFVVKSNLMRVLDQACEHFQVRVVVDETTPNGGSGVFLGAGAFGFVFRVKRVGDEHSHCLALKICVSGHTGSFDNVRRLDFEYGKMRRANDACPNIVIGVEEGGFQRFVDKNNEEVGAALLMSQVGKSYSDLPPKYIVDSLKELHYQNILHGDARLANVVNVNGNPMWIDLCASEFAASSIYFNMELEQ